MQSSSRRKRTWTGAQGTERGTGEDNVDATIVANGTRTKKRKRKKGPVQQKPTISILFLMNASAVITRALLVVLIQ